MGSCPKCGSGDFQRSRARSILEQLRKRFTRRRLHRCAACGWRGWVHEVGLSESPHQPYTRPESDVPPPDLKKIDRGLGARRRRSGGGRSD